MCLDRRLRPILLLTIITVLTMSSGVAQDGDGKRAMTIDDYGRWRTIASVSMSDDGNWMTYAYRRHRSDDTLYVRHVTRDTEYQIPRGSTPVFSDDSQWIAYTIATSFDEAEKLRRDDEPVPQHAGVMNLVTGERFAWDNVRRVSFAPGSRFLALARAKADADAEHDGTDLILRDLHLGREELLGSVGEFGFNETGSLLGHTVDAADRTGNGLYLIDLANGARRPLDNDSLLYARLAWDESGTALAVLKGVTPDGLGERNNVLLTFADLSAADPQRRVLDPASATSFPAGAVISERGSVTWDEDGSTVFFGWMEQWEEHQRDDDAEPLANVDIFHWNDDRIQTVQQRQFRSDRDFTYRAAFHVGDGRIVSLTDANMRTIDVATNGNWGIGRDNRAYISDWEEARADYYRVNPATGERRLFLEGQLRTLGLSPDGGHFLYWKNGHIWDYRLDQDTHVNLTARAPVSFVNQEYDRYGIKPPYGLAGWATDGRAIVLNHRYDLWLQPLDGSAAVMLTGGRGTRDSIRFRYIHLDRDEETIDFSKPVMLSAYGEWTKRSGYFALTNGRLRERLYRDARISSLRKAKNADRVLLTMETFQEFPNYYVASTALHEPERLTDANPWQSEYRWGRSVLFEYNTRDGVRLQGTLAIPDGYGPGQRLPMLVDFYEKRSQDHHRYSRLVFRDTPMFAKYVSNGYLVMQPDVHFNTGTTHDDMLDAVEAATRRVIELGYADPSRIGLHGHSFSGGGASYIATRSTMFAAIVAGAAPINLAGEFNILFHGSGQNNHRYDIYGQGRYGTNPYDDFELYRAQSPITHVRTMDTPLLYLHGTEDGSVEYLQGMEFYNALRFFRKPIIFASYPGEGHHLSKLENQKDFQTRMEQFYDHYLKDAPAADWMVNGVPFLEKERR